MTTWKNVVQETQRRLRLSTKRGEPPALAIIDRTVRLALAVTIEGAAMDLASVTVPGFGSVRVQQDRARKVLDPTGVWHESPARLRVKVRAAKAAHALARAAAQDRAPILGGLKKRVRR